VSLSLASIITESARCFPREVALIEDDRTWTYLDLRSQVLSFAAYLRSIGIGAGDRVALMCGNRPEFTISYYGILSSGASVVSLNNLLVSDEVAYQLGHSEAVGAVADAESIPVLLEAMSRLEKGKWILQAALDPSERVERSEQIKVLSEVMSGHAPLESFVATRPDDTAVVMYTSGTTGRPKGAELTHFNLWENARFCSERAFAKNDTMISPMGPGHVAMAALPLFHSFGQTCVQNALLMNGGTVTYLRRFDPIRLAHIIARDRVTVLNAVPTIFNALIHTEKLDPTLLKTLHYGISGGAALPLDIRKTFEEEFGMPIQEGYGLTETSPVASAQRQWLTPKTGSIGRPIIGVEMKIFDNHDNEVPPGVEGEVVIRGRNVMKGYLKNPEATMQVMRSGWLHSGDIGRMDEDGDFFIVDRKKDLIIRGGYNVYPREVEEVLYCHPDVLEASVIGIPDTHYGEEIKAVVALRNGARITTEDLITYCKTHVAAYKYPRIIEFVDELPKGSTGKILKREIKRMYTEKREEED
jgi:long-chain acyl-CoA synthetase